MGQQHAEEGPGRIHMEPFTPVVYGADIKKVYWREVWSASAPTGQTELGRTDAAIGFRWAGCAIANVRRQTENGIRQKTTLEEYHRSRSEEFVATFNGRVRASQKQTSRAWRRHRPHFDGQTRALVPAMTKSLK